jgi:hypothetical protein
LFVNFFSILFKVLKTLIVPPGLRLHVTALSAGPPLGGVRRRLGAATDTFIFMRFGEIPLAEATLLDVAYCFALGAETTRRDDALRTDRGADAARLRGGGTGFNSCISAKLALARAFSLSRPFLHNIFFILF